MISAVAIKDGAAVNRMIIRVARCQATQPKGSVEILSNGRKYLSCLLAFQKRIWQTQGENLIRSDAGIPNFTIYSVIQVSARFIPECLCEPVLHMPGPLRKSFGGFQLAE